MASWTLQSGTYYQKVSMDQTTQFRVALVVNGGDDTVVYSRDFGATWTPSTGITGNVNTISMNPNGNIVIVGVNSLLSPAFISTNYGVSFTGTYPLASYWTVVGVENNNYMIACDYSGGTATVYLSSNQGSSWSAIASYGGHLISNAAWSYNDGMMAMYTLRFNTNSPYATTLNRTINRGVSWSGISNISSYNLQDVACDQTGQYVVVSAAQDGVYRSTDYGATWNKTALYTNAPAGPNYQQIECDWTGNKISVVDSVNKVIYHSANGGLTWTIQTTTGSSAGSVLGLSMSSNGSVQYASFSTVGTYMVSISEWKDVAFANNQIKHLRHTACDSTSQHMVAIADGGYSISYSSDYGFTWTLSDANSSGNTTYTCMAATPSCQHVVAGFQSTTSGIVYSANYGENFAIVSTGLNFVPSAVAISSDGQTFYAATSTIAGSVYIGTSGGSLIVRNIGVPSLFWNSIACDSTGQLVYATAKGNGTAAPYYMYQYNIGTPYVYLPLNGSTTDIMGNSTITPTGSITYTTGTSSQYAVNLANTPASAASKYIIGTWTGSSSFTMSFWFNAQSLGAQQILVGAYNGQFQLILLGNNQLAFYVPIGGGDVIIYYTPGILQNTWYHLSVSFKQSGLCSMHVNGVQVGTYNNVSSFTGSSSGIFTIGCQDDSRTQAFNGYINDFKIYNTAAAYDTWSPMPRFASSPLLPLSVACDSTGQVLTVAAGTDGVYRSTNGGSTWALKDTMAVEEVIVRPRKTGLSTNTWVQDGISWTSSASTAISGNDPYVPFRSIIDNSWNTTSYTYTPSGNNSGIYSTFYTNGSSTQTVQGDWLQIRSSKPIVMKSYQLGCGNSNNLAGIFYIIASNDGVTWRALQYANAAGRPSYGVYEVITGTITVNSTSSQPWGSTTLATTSYDGSANAYTYFRLIVTNSYYGPGTVAQIGAWVINAIPFEAPIMPQKSGISTNSWSNSGVDWTASASSVNGSWSVYKAFNTIVGDAWLSSNSPSPYNDNGTVNTGVAGSTTVLGGIGVLRGEWVQIQSSTPKVLSSFAYGLGPNPWPYTNAPRTYYIVGSTDGTSWYPIQSGTFAISNFTAAGTNVLINYTGTQTLGGGMPGTVATTAYSSSTRSYTYFRIIGTSIMNYGGSGSTYMELGEWYMNFLDNTTPGALVPYIELPLQGSVADITGNSTVTAYGSIVYLSGPAGNYAVNIFNTVGQSGYQASQYIRGTIPNGMTAFTIKGRFNAQSNANNSYPTIFSMYGVGVIFFMLPGNTIGLNLPSGSGTSGNFIQGPTISLGTWYSFMIIYQIGMCYFYLNDELVGTTTSAGLGSFGSTLFSLGCYDADTNQPFNGFISGIQIYGHVLPPPTGRSITKVASDSTGSNLLVAETTGAYVYQSSNSGSTWTTPVISGAYPGASAGDIQTVSMDSTGTFSFASYYNISSVVNQRSTSLTTLWTTTTGQYYPMITYSTDNQYQAAINVVDRFTATGNNVVAYSTDSGATWTNGADLGGSVNSIAANATGQYVVVIVQVNGTAVPAVYRSTDYGATFNVLSNSPDYWNLGANCIACDSTGQHLYVGTYNGDLYVSSNSGANWNSVSLFYSVYNISCSQSGKYVYALANTNVYISTNYGQAWSTAIIISNYGCNQVACDWSGQNLVAACNGDGIYRSTNYGQTWTRTSAPFSPSVGNGTYYNKIACNSTGQRIIAMDNNNETIYLSLDAGTTWTLQYTPESMTDNAFIGVSMSADGTQYAAGFYNPGSYFLTQGTPDLQPVSVPCFLEGTKILCHVNGEDQYIPIETMRPGTIVKTSMDGYKAVKLIGSRSMQNPGTGVRDKNALYLCTKDNYPEVIEDLTITGCHAILVDYITEAEREGIIATLERIFITDKKYRLPACVDQKAKEVLVPGPNMVWHFALEHYHDKMNYGVYAQGLLVETSPIWHMNTKNYNLVN